MAEQANGGGEGKPFKESTVLLTLDREKFTMQIGGHTENFDEALCMARMAVDYFEARLRAARAGELLNVTGRLPMVPANRGPFR